MFKSETLLSKKPPQNNTTGRNVSRQNQQLCLSDRCHLAAVVIMTLSRVTVQITYIYTLYKLTIFLINPTVDFAAGDRCLFPVSNHRTVFLKTITIIP